MQGHWGGFEHGGTLWNKSFNSKKIQPNLIPSKIIPIGWVDLNSKKNLQFVIGLGR